MSKGEFISRIKISCLTAKEFNSNNSWGFGGAYGTRYYLPNEVVVTVATACYRHLPSTPFIRIDKDGETVFDFLRSSKITEAFNYLKEQKCLRN